MIMKLNIFRGCMHRANVEDPASLSSSSFNLREEYAAAFRTESYNQFWARVLDLTFTHGSNGIQPRTSTTTSAATRLPSYRLFAEHLLDPDQPTITNILSTTATLDANTHSVLSDYYSETASASLVCGRLLLDIDRIRRLYCPLNTKLHSNKDEVSLQTAIEKYLTVLSKTLDSGATFQAMHDGSDRLAKKLEHARNHVRTKIRLFTCLKCALTVFLVIVAASATMVGVHVAAHGLTALVFSIPTSFSARRLERVRAQLDAAAKGTYILNRDLDTISRLVERMRDEVEHMVALLGFCRDDRRRLTAEVVRQIWKNDERFKQQLDELEEHLYLCFMTINRARSLVLKEVLASTKDSKNSSS